MGFARGPGRDRTTRIAEVPGVAIDNDPVAAQYESWVYPEPIADLAEAIAQRGNFDVSDPSLVRRKLWPKRVEPDDLDILIAGCGANQAAHYAFQNPTARVVGVDISEASLAHEHVLKQKHDLRNLELYRLDLEEVGSLERTFDLIVSSGVIHHLPDPAAALRTLGEALAPRGVVSLMLYGYYPRVGVHMLQEAFRVLGLRQDAAGIAMVRHTLDSVLPARHHIAAYRDPDRGFDAGLVDTYLHPRERAYTVPDVLQLVSDSGLKFQGWLDNLDYTISLHISKPQDPLRQAIEALPLPEQWRVIELIGQALARHFVLACHVDRPVSDYTLDFTGQAWLDYVPSLRRPIAVSPAGSGEPPSETASVKRYGHRVELDATEEALLERIDGKRSIIEIVEDAGLDEATALQHVEHARRFFRKMAGWDHLLYEIP
jgi:SAM-dependent methyltransferase